MNILVILPYYLSWHYSQSFNDFLRIWSNFISFLYNLFSIRILASTLFSPWERINDQSAKGAAMEDIIGNFIFNGLMRVVGAVIRLVAILAGLFSILLCFCLGAVLFVVWIFLPVIIVWLFWWGINQILP